MVTGRELELLIAYLRVELSRIDAAIAALEQPAIVNPKGKRLVHAATRAAGHSADYWPRGHSEASKRLKPAPPDDNPE